jgi:hypothetical protein
MRSIFNLIIYSLNWNVAGDHARIFHENVLGDKKGITVRVLFIKKF